MCLKLSSHRICRLLHVFSSFEDRGSGRFLIVSKTKFCNLAVGQHFCKKDCAYAITVRFTNRMGILILDFKFVLKEGILIRKKNIVGLGRVDTNILRVWDESESRLCFYFTFFFKLLSVSCVFSGVVTQLQSLRAHILHVLDVFLLQHT